MMNLQSAKLYLRNYENYIKIFGADILLKALENFDDKDFSTTKYVVLDGGEDNYYNKKGYPILCDRTTWEFEEYKGEWMSKVRKPAREYRVSDNYQLEESKLLKDCLLIKFPYLINFEFPTYHLDREDDEIYIKCDNKCSLYVPIKALLNNDWTIVENRMTTYWNWYYNKPERKEYLEKELSTLKTQTALSLKEKISIN